MSNNKNHYRDPPSPVELTENLWLYRFLSVVVDKPAISRSTPRWKSAHILLCWVPMLLKGICYYRCSKFIEYFFISPLAKQRNPLVREPWHYLQSVSQAIGLGLELELNQEFICVESWQTADNANSAEDKLIIQVLLAIKRFRCKTENLETDQLLCLKTQLEQMQTSSEERQQLLLFIVEGLQALEAGNKADWKALLNRYEVFEDESTFDTPAFNVVLMLVALGRREKAWNCDEPDLLVYADIGLVSPLLGIVSVLIFFAFIAAMFLAAPIYYYLFGGNIGKFHRHYVEAYDPQTMGYMQIIGLLFSPIIIYLLVQVFRPLFYATLYRVLDLYFRLTSRCY